MSLLDSASKNGPNKVGIICNTGSIDVSAVHEWARDFPEIAHLIIYSKEMYSKSCFSGLPEMELLSELDGKEELCHVFHEVLKECPNQITEENIQRHLIHKCEPDLLIIVGGNRLPNVLLWQSIYAELYFTGVPLRKRNFYNAVRDYKKRNRKFGR